MPQESQLAHRVLSDTNLPYQTNISPSNTDPHYISGSHDLMTSVNGYAERRPGFADAVEPTPTVFNNLQRLFTWDRFDGTFIEMACDINASGFAQVFKRIVGTDASFVSLYTDTTAVPFDFVVSNNTCYFSNGNVAQKWNPAIGVQNWGIAIGSVNNITGPDTTAAGANSGTGTAWTNPNNVTSATNFATVTIGTGSSQHLQATQFAFAIPATTIITGIAVTYDFQGTPDNTPATISLLKGGSVIGTPKVWGPGGNHGIITNNVLGGVSDLWGTTWTANDANQTTFGVDFSVSRSGVGTDTFSIRNVRITIYGLGGPSISVSGSAGSMNATAGYSYVFCYGNSLTGHISSPSPASSSTGIFTNKLKVTVTLTASTDAQVNQIRVFRTTDGGGGEYFELPNSPFPNTSGNIDDNAADSALIVSSIAPTATFNDPPTPIQGMVYFSGRIWGFVGNKVWFSGLEEINQGVPEESFPSGIAGNFWSFDQPVQGLGVAGIAANQTIGIFCGGRLYGIQGNTLDTFQRFSISNRRGCRNRTCISMLGGMVAWLDSANQVWASDGSSLNELGVDIRPDLASLNPATCSLTFHAQGRAHWLVLSTGTKLYIYDIDMGQWMPPWNFAAQYIFSGETSPGNYVLMAATPTKALQMNTAKFNDNGATYSPVGQLSLLSIVPDFGRRFSYIAMGQYNEPTRTGVPWTFMVTNNAKTITDFGICTDDDPTQATYTSIAANLQDTSVTYNRVNGTFMKQNVYPTTSPSARWVSMKITLANADQVDNLYEYVMAYKPLGGR
jgi:hypothetical protein